jgi:hypothetical protein
MRGPGSLPTMTMTMTMTMTACTASLGYLRLLRFLAPAGQLGCGRTPAAVADPGWRPATLTDWPMAVRGPALVSVTAARPRAFYPVWLMFLQHRMRCMSTIRRRASLTILAGWC